VQTKEQRDEKTLAIMTAIALFVLVLVVGGFVLWGASQLFDWSEGGTRTASVGLLCAAGVIMVGYLARQRQP